MCTPSQVGALTEVFRQMPDVARSLHPTHPVSGWGRHAKELLGTHHLGSTFGITSPFYKLRQYKGLVVGLGTRLRHALTILHVPEELNPQARELAFEESPRTMRIVNGPDEILYEFRVMRKGVARKYKSVERTLLQAGVLRYVRAAGLQCAVTEAGAYIDLGLELARRNSYMLRARASQTSNAI